jgi:hypothetical protein
MGYQHTCAYPKGDHNELLLDGDSLSEYQGLSKWHLHVLRYFLRSHFGFFNSRACSWFKERLRQASFVI